MKRLSLLPLVMVLYFGYVGLLHSIDRSPIFKTTITNEDENKVVDVIDLGDGTKALRTSGLVQIEQLFGTPSDAVWWGYIGTANDANGVGSAGDYIQTQIEAAPIPLNVSYPAIIVSTPVTTQIVNAPNPERELAEAHCADLTADPDFNNAFKCAVIKDYSAIFINSKLYNEFGERLGATGIQFTATGTTVVTPAFTEIKRRGLGTELARSPNDPRQGVLNISGSINLSPEGVGLIFREFLLNGGSSDQTVDGSVTPVAFRFEAHPTLETIVESIECWCTDNGIKLGQYCGINSVLSNGNMFTVRSQGVTNNLLTIKSTDDWKHLFAAGQGAFDLTIQSGRDDLSASLEFANSFIISQQGANPGGDDYIEMSISDDLTSVIDQACVVTGFRREP